VLASNGSTDAKGYEWSAADMTKESTQLRMECRKIETQERRCAKKVQLETKEEGGEE
jgi:hypothetical protein